MTSRSSERGFTIIEALVALAIGGFVIAIIASITGHWLKTWRAGLPALERAETLTTALDRIAGDLAAAKFVPAGPDGLGMLFSGGPAAVTLVRHTLPVEAPAGLEIVRLAPQSGRDDVTLARSRASIPFGTFPTRPIDPSPVALLRAPYGMRFSYADRDQRWQTDWTSDKRLPRFVRVEVVDRRTGRAVLAPIVVGVHADSPVRCATALTSGTLCDAAMGLDTGPPPAILGMKSASGATP